MVGCVKKGATYWANAAKNKIDKTLRTILIPVGKSRRTQAAISTVIVATSPTKELASKWIVPRPNSASVIKAKMTTHCNSPHPSATHPANCHRRVRGGGVNGKCVRTDTQRERVRTVSFSLRHCWAISSHSESQSQPNHIAHRRLAYPRLPSIDSYLPIRLM